VVLEELTGINCQYCPDGHLRAKQIADANPGRVVLVNIHAGGYATPGAGQPDLRTTAGTALDAFLIQRATLQEQYKEQLLVLKLY
jgi:hypothetical protein